jgi:hypothetical protein
VSNRVNPVTQVAEVAVNRASKKPQLSPEREAAGKLSSNAPKRMMPAKVNAITRVALSCRDRLKNNRRTNRSFRFFTGHPLLSRYTLA